MGEVWGKYGGSMGEVWGKYGNSPQAPHRQAVRSVLLCRHPRRQVIPILSHIFPYSPKLSHKKPPSTLQPANAAKKKAAVLQTAASASFII